MEKQNAPIDVLERDLAYLQLDELALANDGQPWPVWKDAVAEWHTRSLVAARSDVWIPGLAGPQEPIVEEALGRFYQHHVCRVIRSLRLENVELQRKLISALQCAHFYATGATDGGERAKSTVEGMLMSSPRTAPGP